MSITVKLELNGRKLGYPKHCKKESLLCRKNRGFRLTSPSRGTLMATCHAKADKPKTMTSPEANARELA
jgi:hypothetical protein